MKQVQGTSLVELLVSLLILSFSTLPLLIGQWRMMQSLHESERFSHILLTMNNVSERLLSGESIDADVWVKSAATTTPMIQASLTQQELGAITLIVRWPPLDGQRAYCRRWPQSDSHCLIRSL